MDNRTIEQSYNSNLFEYVVTTNDRVHRVTARSSKAAIALVERIDNSGWISISLSSLN